MAMTLRGKARAAAKLGIGVTLLSERMRQTPDTIERPWRDRSTGKRPDYRFESDEKKLQAWLDEVTEWVRSGGADRSSSPTANGPSDGANSGRGQQASGSTARNHSRRTGPRKRTGAKSKTPTRQAASGWVDL